MKIIFDVYTESTDHYKHTTIHQVVIEDEDIIALAKTKFMENPPTIMEHSFIRDIVKIKIEID
jgi:hypothetical protein